MTNLEFLKMCFGDDYIWSHVCCFPDDPSNLPNNRRFYCWGGDYYGRTILTDNTNQYYTISTFYADEDNRARRRKALFRATHVIVADDVREKLPVELVNKLPKPTFKLETSPGSEQHGWVLDIPCQDMNKVNNLLDGLVTHGISPTGKDPGMKGVTRYVRLPEGINTKASRVEANGGVAPRCRLLEVNPDVRVSIEDLARPFNIDLEADRRDGRVDGAATVEDHPILDLEDIVAIKSVRSDGRFDITCPWVDEHTGAADDGSAVFTNNDGTIGFKCHHGSCQHRTGRDLLDLIEESRPGFRKELEHFKCLRVFDQHSASLNFISDPPNLNFAEQPQELPDELLPVKPFDLALIPGALRPWVQDVCERIQCPPDFVGVAVMACLAAVIGRNVGVRPQRQTDWTVISNMWAMVVGRPGVMKSPAIEAALSPLKMLMAESNIFHDSQYEEFLVQKRAAKIKSEFADKEARARLAKAKDADVTELLQANEPDEPVLRRYIANDSTFQALGELLRQNQNGFLAHRDEMVSLLKSLDREDQVEARGFYLTAWNGDSSYTFDRIGRGLNMHIPALCLSLLGGTQPGRLASYVNQAVRGGSADDGLIQRFGLLVWPDVSSSWKDVDRFPDNDAKKNAFQVFRYLDNFQPVDIGALTDTDQSGNPDGIPYLRIDDAGQDLFLEWRSTLEHRLRSNDLHPAMESHLSKYRKLIPGLALIIHLADRGVGPLSKTSIEAALAWSDYLESHAHRVYGSVSQPEVTAAKAILKHVRKGNLEASFTSRDIYRRGWSMLTDRGQVESALQLLIDYDWLSVLEQRGNGRPKTMYLVNPKIYK